MQASRRLNPLLMMTPERRNSAGVQKALQSPEYKRTQTEAFQKGRIDSEGKPIFTDPQGNSVQGYRTRRGYESGQNAVGGVTTVGVTYGPGQDLMSVGQWNYDGFGDRNEDVGEFGSVRDDSGQRFNEDRNGNVVDVGNRINARVGESSPTQGNRGGMGGGLNWLNQRSPLAQMGRDMSPAQRLLSDPIDDEFDDPFSASSIAQRKAETDRFFNR